MASICTHMKSHYNSQTILENILFFKSETILGTSPWHLHSSGPLSHFWSVEITVCVPGIVVYTVLWVSTCITINGSPVSCGVWGPGKGMWLHVKILLSPSHFTHHANLPLQREGITKFLSPGQPRSGLGTGVKETLLRAPLVPPQRMSKENTSCIATTFAH